MLPYFMALGANLCFSSGTIVFTKFSRMIGSQWMNYVKALIACFGFLLTTSFIYGWNELTLTSLILLLSSGLMGLCFGDILLLLAFKEIGASRTLVIFGFSPLIVGSLSFVLFNQAIDAHKFWAILFFVATLITFSRENFKINQSWGIKGILLAIGGVALDGLGIIMTRYAFNDSPELLPIEANFYRAFAAVGGFFIINFFRPIHLIDHFKKLAQKDKFLVIIGSVLGTYLSLLLYLQAIKTAHLATLTGITITSPIFASIWECALDKKLPSKYLIIAFVFFVIGMSFLIDL